MNSRVEGEKYYAQQWSGKVFMIYRISFTKLPQGDMEVNDSHPKEL